MPRNSKHATSTQPGATCAPDLTEAHRLLDAGMKLVKLKPDTKQPKFNDWRGHIATRIDPKATGYGLLLEENNRCSIDPDDIEKARIGLHALGFDLEAIMQAGVRTISTRPGSGGRSMFVAPKGVRRVTFNTSKGTALELLTGKRQDVIPGLVYFQRDGSGPFTQHYANGATYADERHLPPEFVTWWQRMSTDDRFRKEQQRLFARACGDTEEQAQKAVHHCDNAPGSPLPFPSPLRVPFNKAHRVEDILAAHGYTTDGRRWAPPTATGTYGVRLIPGKQDLWQSDHASDPLNGTFDAWAAFVVLDHGGNLEAATAAQANLDTSKALQGLGEVLKTRHQRAPDPAISSPGIQTEPPDQEADHPHADGRAEKAPPTHQDGPGDANEGQEVSDSPGTEKNALAAALDFVAERLNDFMPATADDPLINESAMPFLNRAVIEQAVRSSTYASKAGDIITYTDRFIEFSPIEWARLLPDFIGDAIGNRLEYSKKVLETVAQRRAARGMTKTEETAFKRRAQVAPGQAVADFLKVHAQCKTAAFTVDMFATHPSVTVTDHCAQFTLPFKPLNERGARDDVAADFTEHFPEFADFLRLLLMARFAIDRRRAFLWQQAPSDWGKGLLASVLRDIGILFELSIPLVEKALRGDPVGFDPTTAAYGWVMYVDEFNKASRELKQLNSYISMSAKWQMQALVALYVKWFTSKESVRSLVGNGAEEQFNNRFSLIVGKDTVISRPLFKQIGNAAYARGLAGYIARVLNQGVAEMRALGPKTAAQTAERWLDTFQAAHRLSDSHGELEDTYRGVADNITSMLHTFAKGFIQEQLKEDHDERRLRKFLEANAAVRFTKEHGRVLLIKRLPAFVTLYIDSTETKQSAAQLSYGAEHIANMINQRDSLDMGKVRLFRTADCSGTGEPERGAILLAPEPSTK